MKIEVKFKKKIRKSHKKPVEDVEKVVVYDMDEYEQGPLMKDPDPDSDLGWKLKDSAAKAGHEIVGAVKVEKPKPAKPAKPAKP